MMLKGISCLFVLLHSRNHQRLMSKNPFFLSPIRHLATKVGGAGLNKALAAAAKSVKIQKEEIIIREEDLEEKYSRGTGPGGQCVNKTSNKVQLTHVPTGITISCHETRDLVANRKIARRKLKEQIDFMVNGKLSKVELQREKIRKRKARAKRRSNKKYSDLDTEDNQEGKEGKEKKIDGSIEEENDDEDDDDDDDTEDIVNPNDSNKKKKIDFDLEDDDDDDDDDDTDGRVNTSSKSNEAPAK